MAAVTAAASPLNLVGIEHKLPTNNEQSDRNGHVVSPPAVTTTSAISSPTAAIDEKSMRKIWHLTGQLSTLLSRNQRNLGVLCRGADQYMTRPRQSSVISIQESPSTTTTTEYPELPLITTPAEIQQIQTENTRLKDRNRLLEDETRELTQIVREHERTLETVMDRFRAQTFMVQQAMSEMQRAHMLTLLAEQKRAVMLDQEVARLKGIIGHINNRVRYAVHLQSSLDDEEQQALTQLEAENTQLRQLLYIADDNIGNNSALATSSTSTITPVYLNASQPLIANPDKHSNQEDST
ncbi:hypothetical protein BDF22DRAFT_180382 [Syncephalis plumigaleata]|nr:hypothetical protein BDF22DRAFT_180382 [Syncephalis plumigaleata]